MKKSEALLIKREILDSCKGAISEDSVSIDVVRLPNSGSYDCRILLNCDLTPGARLSVISAISKYDVIMKKEGGSTVIYTP